MQASSVFQGLILRLRRRIGQVQISALSRTLNARVHIYRLDEKIEGMAPHKDDIPAHCIRFIPTGQSWCDPYFDTNINHFFQVPPLSPIPFLYCSAWGVTIFLNEPLPQCSGLKRFCLLALCNVAKIYPAVNLLNSS